MPYFIGALFSQNRNWRNQMAAELELRWLKTDSVRGAAKRFAIFCKEDIKEQSKNKDFDIGKYESAVKLVLQKLDNSISVEELFNDN